MSNPSCLSQAAVQPGDASLRFHIQMPCPTLPQPYVVRTPWILLACGPSQLIKQGAKTQTG